MYCFLKFVVPGLLFLFFSCAGKKSDTNTGKIMELSGEVYFLVSPDSSPRRAVKGAQLEKDNVISTGQSGACLVQIGNSAVMQLRGQTTITLAEMYLDQKTGQESTKIRMSSGKLVTKVSKLMNASDSFSIETPTVIAGVRGTEFSVDMTGNKKDTVAVLKGKVAMRRAITAVDSSDAEKYSGLIRQKLAEEFTQTEIIIDPGRQAGIDRADNEKLNAVISAAADDFNERIQNIEKNTAADSKQKPDSDQSGITAVLQSMAEQSADAVKNAVASSALLPVQIEAVSETAAVDIKAINEIEIQPLKKIKPAEQPDITEKTPEVLQYETLISGADQAFKAGSYEKALDLYNQAAALFPALDYAVRRTKAIKTLLTKQEKLNMQSQQEKKYAELITAADTAFAQKKYPEACAFYKNSLQIKNNEHILRQITVIEQIIASSQKADQPRETSADTKAPMPDPVLDIKIQPGGALVEISGNSGKIKYTGRAISVQPGSYHIKISKTGYLPQEIKLDLAAGDKHIQTASLKKRLDVSQKIILLDGTEIEGKILKQDTDSVIIETGDGEKKISRAEIQDIKFLKK